MKTCPDCGERVYSLGCVNCNEAAYIEEQAARDYRDEYEPATADRPRRFADAVPLPDVGGRRRDRGER